MSEQESNVCAICGGAKAIWYQVESVTKADLSKRIEKAISKPGAPFRICPGHPEPAPNHDNGIQWGDLGDGATICHDESWGMDHVGIYTHRNGESVVLTLKQFQCVLAWGEHNRDELQRLAKEQGE